MKTYTPKDTDALHQLLILLIFPWALVGVTIVAVIESLADKAFGLFTEWAAKESDIDAQWQ